MTRVLATAVLAACATPPLHREAGALAPPARPLDLLAAPGRSLDDCAFAARYRVYVEAFVTPEGRVVDGDRTTSEGQAYALFHALVADDRALFSRVLAWTDANLAGGSLGPRLAAWLWSRGEIRDANSAADADLWMAYALLEAGRLWAAPDLAARGLALAGAIREREVLEVPGFGAVLLPGPQGFVTAEAVRLNPSYLVIPQLRRLALADPQGPWSRLAESAGRLLVEAAPHGIAPDWIAVSKGALVRDPVKGATASYDAIRVPLWAGMLAGDEPLRPALQRAAAGLLALVRDDGNVPESVDAESGAASLRDGPPCVAAALLPLSRALGDAASQAALRRRATLGTSYYDHNLALFALAWDEGRARFDRDGRLFLSRGAACTP